jgi:hypothetical protein
VISEYDGRTKVITVPIIAMVTTNSARVNPEEPVFLNFDSI